MSLKEKTEKNGPFYTFPDIHFSAFLQLLYIILFPVMVYLNGVMFDGSYSFCG